MGRCTELKPQLYFHNLYLPAAARAFPPQGDFFFVRFFSKCCLDGTFVHRITLLYYSGFLWFVLLFFKKEERKKIEKKHTDGIQPILK